MQLSRHSNLDNIFRSLSIKIDKSNEYFGKSENMKGIIGDPSKSEYFEGILGDFPEPRAD